MKGVSRDRRELENDKDLNERPLKQHIESPDTSALQEVATKLYSFVGIQASVSEVESDDLQNAFEWGLRFLKTFYHGLTFNECVTSWFQGSELTVKNLTVPIAKMLEVELSWNKVRKLSFERNALHPSFIEYFARGLQKNQSLEELLFDDEITHHCLPILSALFNHPKLKCISAFGGTEQSVMPILSHLEKDQHVTCRVYEPWLISCFEANEKLKTLHRGESGVVWSELDKLRSSLEWGLRFMKTVCPSSDQLILCNGSKLVNDHVTTTLSAKRLGAELSWNKVQSLEFKTNTLRPSFIKYFVQGLEKNVSLRDLLFYKVTHEHLPMINALFNHPNMKSITFYTLEPSVVPVVVALLEKNKIEKARLSLLEPGAFLNISSHLNALHVSINASLKAWGDAPFLDLSRSRNLQSLTLHCQGYREQDFFVLTQFLSRNKTLRYLDLFYSPFDNIYVPILEILENSNFTLTEFKRCLTDAEYNKRADAVLKRNTEINHTMNMAVAYLHKEKLISEDIKPIILSFLKCVPEAWQHVCHTSTSI